MSASPEEGMTSKTTATVLKANSSEAPQDLQQQNSHKNDAGAATEGATRENKFLAAREARRIENQQKKTKKSTQNAEQTKLADDFWRSFHSTIQAVEQGLASLSTSTDNDTYNSHESKKLADLSADLQTLQRDVNEAAKSKQLLSPLDERRALGQLRRLRRQVETASTRVGENGEFRREKFSFRRFRAAYMTHTHSPGDEPESITFPKEQAENDDAPAQNEKKAQFSSPDKTCPNQENVFEKKSHCTLSLTDHPRRDKEANSCSKKENGFQLRQLDSCIVVLKESFAYVKFQQLSHCTVYCGPVAGSAYIEDCHDCTIFVASRQLRIHHSTNVQFHVHVLSGPILEHCQNIKFSGFYHGFLFYKELQEQMRACHFLTLVKTANQGEVATPSLNAYDRVKDFNWHHVMKKSPNWSLMEAEEAKLHKAASPEIEILQQEENGKEEADSSKETEAGPLGAAKEKFDALPGTVQTETEYCDESDDEEDEL